VIATKLLKLCFRSLTLVFPRIAYQRADKAADLEITQVHIALSRLPSSLEGLRVAHLSDFHLGRWVSREYLRAGLEKANALNPDIVLLTGDYASASKRVPWVGEVFAPLKAPLGVWGVLGNHDHDNGPEGIAWQLMNVDIRILRNEAHPFPGAKEGFWLIGVDDPISQADRLEDAIRAVPESDGKLLLAHAPDIAFQAALLGVDLMLSGHTHGGQVVLPGIGSPAAILSDRHRSPFRSGLYRLGAMQVYVTRGIGVTGIPFRIACRPEISLLILHRG